MSVCPKCSEREGTIRFGDALSLTHGGAKLWCRRCVLRFQVAHAEERAAVLPDLRRELAIEEASRV